jgi:multiple sugar transport system permease protein
MNRRARRRTAEVLALLAALLVAVIAVAPILWGLSTALKPEAQILVYPPRWLPHPPTLATFLSVWRDSPLPVYFRNSVITTTGALALSLLVAVHAAYAFSRFRFRGHSALLVGLLATSMMPGVAILVPLYHLAVITHLYNTYVAMILVYAAWNIPILVWLLRGFFDTVPRELEEAALVDGCGRMHAFYRIVLPMSRPGLLSAAVLVIMYVWNDFLIAFTLTIDDPRRTLSVGLYTYVSNYGIDYGHLMAATIIALVPVVAVFFMLQRHLISGLMSGALKG